ncbi:gamma-glutamylcyclotransferase [Pseudanabaena biceps]|nr:gamma-glutamylcyclotransferase [Pseudanabaena biceps]
MIQNLGNDLQTLSQTHSPCRVFVYGTLKPKEDNFEAYCADGILSSQPAIAYGEIFALPMGYPAMVLGDQSSQSVYGYLFTFPDRRTLESLDELEDYQCDRPSCENLYNRQEIEVFDLAVNSLGLAWVYVMTKEQVNKFNGIPQPNGSWSGLTT